jgi:O-antigen/teichoic acid export membrane protein
LKSSSLVFLKVCSDIGGKLAALGVLALAARALTIEAFALMALASTLGWMLSVATDFGLQLHLAREVARAPADAGRTLWPLLTRRTQLFAAGVAGAVIVAFVWLPIHDAIPFAGVACAYLLSSMVEFLNYAYRGLNRSDIESWLNFAQRIGTLAVAFALLSMWPSFVSVAVAMILPPLVASVVSVAMLRRMAPVDAQAVANEGVAGLFLRVAPIGAGILLSALYFRIDLFLLQRWSTAEAVAQYGAVFRLIDAMRLFPAALLAVVLPRMFRGRDVAFLLKLSIGLTLFGAAAAIAVSAAAPVIVPLAFGRPYAAATPLFRILLIAFPLLSLNYGLTTQLIGWNGQRAFAAINAGALAANIAMNAYLIPRMSAAGAAWVTVATEALLTLACVCALARVPGRATTALRDRSQPLAGR